jgi:DNA-binding response OmpR family regulator
LDKAAATHLVFSNWSKLNEGSKPDVIETVRGVGYRMADNG